MALVLAALVTFVVGTVIGVGIWIHNTAYLIEQDGKVAIYQGIPETVPGLETHWLIRVTDVEVDDLQPSAQSHIREGLRVDNRDIAEVLVSEYERQARESSAKDATKDASESASTSSSSASTSANASS
jgi:protein phosphatase